MSRMTVKTLREEMLGVARGERPPSARPAGPMLAALSVEAIDLMKAVLQERPDNLSELVRLTGRAQPNVSRSLQHLASYGLIRLVRHGKEVRPEPIVATLVVDLATGTYETRPVSETAA